MPRISLELLLVTGLLAALGCDGPSGGPLAPDAQFAKGGPGPTSAPIVMTFLSEDRADLMADGKGAYQNGVCGVYAVANIDASGTGYQMAPRGASIPKSQAAACAGIAPRGATMRLAVKHVSDNPHVDDPAPTDGGTFNLVNIKLAPLGATVINAGPACFHVDRNGRIMGLGLRLDSQNFPGSNNLVRNDLGGGLLHVFTAPYPNNVAFCEDDSGVSYWHVVVDLQVQILTQ